MRHKSIPIRNLRTKRVMASTRKRPRSAVSTKRPIDKELKVVVKGGMAGTQVATTLKTTTFPCTIVGLRWEISAFQDGGTGGGSYSWAIVVVRDGNSASAIATSDGSDFYTPEQDVLTFGRGAHDNNVSVQMHSGSTKTMRKLLGGDLLQFIAVGTATNTTDLRATVQFFCKS